MSKVTDILRKLAEVHSSPFHPWPLEEDEIAALREAADRLDNVYAGAFGNAEFSEVTECVPDDLGDDYGTFLGYFSGLDLSGAGGQS